MIILYGRWVYMFDTQKVPEVRYIGSTSIEAVWPKLDQTNQYKRAKAPCMQNFRSFCPLGAVLWHPLSENRDFALPLFCRWSIVLGSQHDDSHICLSSTSYIQLISQFCNLLYQGNVKDLLNLWKANLYLLCIFRTRSSEYYFCQL